MIYYGRPAQQMRTLYFCPVVSSIFFLFFLSSPNLSRHRLDVYQLPYFHTWRGSRANLECRSERRCTQLTANAGPKNVAKKSPSGHHPTTLSGYIFATKACIDNRKKNLLSSNISSTWLPYVTGARSEIKPLTCRSQMCSSLVMTRSRV